MEPSDNKFHLAAAVCNGARKDKPSEWLTYAISDVPFIYLGTGHIIPFPCGEVTAERDVGVGEDIIGRTYQIYILAYPFVKRTHRLRGSYGPHCGLITFQFTVP